MTISEFNPHAFLKDIDPQDFLTFGVEQVAYIRPTVVDEQDLYAIYAADGTQLFIVESYQAALRAIHISDLDASTLQ